jgi:type II secretory pathway pseudopilin PulG
MQQNLSHQVRCHTGEPRNVAARRQRDGGYLLLAILLMMALMIIAATIVAPRLVQQIKRDREEEMIHRGTEYARAIKKYYKKFGRYPATLDQLDNTNQIRFLRRHYKDPLTKDGKWKLLNYGDIATLLNTAGPGTPAAALGGALGGGLSPGGAVLPGAGGSATAGSYLGAQQQQSQQSSPFANTFSASSSQGNQDPNIVYPQNYNGPPTSNGANNQFIGTQASAADSGQAAAQQANQSGASPFGQNAGGNQSSSGNAGGNSPFGQNTTGGGQTFGGGAIVGVASLSKDPTIRIYNKKKTYNEWQFIYNPIMDTQNVLLRGPYQPTTIGGAQIGTPASQMNGPQGAFGQQQNGQQQNGQQQNGFGQQQNGFGQQQNGQQQNGFGQQQNGFGQQQNAPQQPGGNFPPDQNQQPQ